MDKPILGIDLGTTHTVASVYEGLEIGEAPVILPLEQPVDGHSSARRALLPSVLFAPVGDEGLHLRHPDDGRFLFGEHAQKRGAEAPPRLVSSAKSWLSNARVDREAALLPWGAADETLPRLSPVDASTRYLQIVARSFLQRGMDTPSHDRGELDDAEIVLTIPASFDEAARELTLAAARRAGLDVSLVEEPTAAFHDWLHRAGRDGLGKLLEGGPEAFVLVVDVGGGTTDLSLLHVTHDASTTAPSVARVAVSDHLLLGGDNMDLALAHHLEPVFSGLRDERLDPSRFGELCHATRRAKETLLSIDAPNETTVTLLGRGSKLLGGAMSASLTADTVHTLLVEGFLPMVTPDTRPVGARGGLRAAGLPYARDPAISRHLAAFLGRADVSASLRTTTLGQRPAPLWLLPNGGVFRSPLLVARLAAVLASLTERPLRVLEDRDTDLAVARGAVAYALARRGRGIRIRSGAPRSYFLGVADGGGPAGEGTKLLSVLPRGSEPGQRHRVDLPLAIMTGRRVRFDVFTSNAESPSQPGELRELDEHAYERLPPFATTLPASGPSGAVPVALEAELTEVGTLALFAFERDVPAPRSFRLELQLRGEHGFSLPPTSTLAPAMLSVAPPRSGAPRRLVEANELLARVFGGDPQRREDREARDLVKQIERILGERSSWDAAVCRGIVDALLPFAEARRRSADHERAFFSLAGYGLRPGIGDDGDEARVEALFQAAEESLATAGPARDAKGYQQIFVALRRIAAGLDEAAQTQLFAWGIPYADGRARKKGPPNGADDELLSLLAFLHRAPRRERVALGDSLVERTYAGASPRSWELVARLGARRLAYGSAHLALEAKHVEPWVEDLLRERWDKLATARKAIRELGRVTGERSLDLAPALRARIVKRLAAEGADATYSDPVDHLVEESRLDEGDAWGEALPPGLTLGRPA
jgi:hypothetical protein